MKTRLMWRLVFLLSLLAVITARPGLVLGQEKVVWRMAEVTLQWSSYQDILNSVPARIAQATRGRLEIVKSTDPLKPQEYMAALREGRVDAATLLGLYYRMEIPIINVGSLPGLFGGVEVYQKVTDEFLFDSLSKILKEKYKIVPLATGALSQSVIFSKKPIRTMADLKGLKVRIAQTEASKLLAYHGAATMMLPGDELIPAMERGVIDAAAFSGPTAYGFDIFKVTTYAYDWGIGDLTPFFLVASEKAWNGLPTRLRSIVELEFKKIQAEGFDLVVREHYISRAALKERGVVIFTPTKGDTVKLRDQNLLHNLVYKEWVELNNKLGIMGADELLERIRKSVAKTKGSGDPCYDPTCRCSDGSCKIECCPKR